MCYIIISSSIRTRNINENDFNNFVGLSDSDNKIYCGIHFWKERNGFKDRNCEILEDIPYFLKKINNLNYSIYSPDTIKLHDSIESLRFKFHRLYPTIIYQIVSNKIALDNLRKISDIKDSDFLLKIRMDIDYSSINKEDSNNNIQTYIKTNIQGKYAKNTYFSYAIMMKDKDYYFNEIYKCKIYGAGDIIFITTPYVIDCLYNIYENKTDVLKTIISYSFDNENVLFNLLRYLNIKYIQDKNLKTGILKSKI